MKTPPLPAWAGRLLGLDPMVAPPHVFGLDAGELRYVRVPRRDGRLAVAEQHAVALPLGTAPGGTMGEVLPDRPGLEEAVRDLLARVAAPVAEASLVLPDAWMRLTFVEVSELPRSTEARQEVLRWKLKKTLPFRIEELRLSAAEVAPVPGQREPRRLLVGFAHEALLSTLEEVFAARGVRLGCVTNVSSALLGAVAEQLAAVPLGALVVARPADYTLLVARHGEPVLYRHKNLDDSLPAALQASSVERDLRLTGAFLGDQLPELELGAVLLFAPAGEQRWGPWIGEGLGCPPTLLSRDELAAAVPEGMRWEPLAPLVGAVAQEIA